VSAHRPQPPWREFERLVAMIEESAAPRGAVVTSPDRIRDLTTNEMREVDASIRFSAGSVDILITIECQKRSRKADDTWIEQLATKRQKLGAAKTIAVSAKGFTRAAHLTARQHGIELRTLSEIRPQDVADWFLHDEIVNLIPETANLRCAVKVEGAAEYIEIGDSDEAVFFHDRVKSPFSAIVFWQFDEMANPRRFANLPQDGSVTRVEIQIDATKPDLIPIPNTASRQPSPPLLVALDGQHKVVTALRLSADVSISTISFDAADGVHHAYEGAGGPIAQHARFKGEAFGLPVTLDLTSQAGGVGGSVEFPSGARLGLGWTDKVPASHLIRDTCAFCGGRVDIKSHAVIPQFLVPSGASARECFLCSSCARRFEHWDSYGEEVWRHVPEDLAAVVDSAFSLRRINGNIVRLWLLSLLWRIGVSRALSMVELGDDEAIVRGVLSSGNLCPAEQYPVTCIALSSEGKRVQFFFPPRVRMVDGHRVISIVFQGVLFNFFVGIDASDNARLVTDNEWMFPVVDWREVDFLVEEALKIKATSRPGR